MNKKKIMLFGIILFLVIGIVILAKFLYKNNIQKKSTKPISCNENASYCIYKYDGNEYFVLNNDYNGEYNIEYFDVNTKDLKNIKDFSYLTYTEYSDFCLKYNINKKYNNENSNYIIYFYSNGIANSIDAKLGDVEYENNKVTLYMG